MLQTAVNVPPTVPDLVEALAGLGKPEPVVSLAEDEGGNVRQHARLPEPLPLLYVCERHLRRLLVLVLTLLLLRIFVCLVVLVVPVVIGLRVLLVLFELLRLYACQLQVELLLPGFLHPLLYPLRLLSGLLHLFLPQLDELLSGPLLPSGMELRVALGLLLCKERLLDVGLVVFVRLADHDPRNLLEVRQTETLQPLPTLLLSEVALHLHDDDVPLLRGGCHDQDLLDTAVIQVRDAKIHVRLVI
mmetsp:Transcript_5124/g.15194  ORF Transcript_5124/g.15194 Transcript_5124/m.15194 type:complete len:245 (+) Transcript_5124:961-1695(+)